MENYIRVLLKIGNDSFKLYGIEASEKLVLVSVSLMKSSEVYGPWDEVHFNYPQDGKFHASYKTNKEKGSERYITAYSGSISDKTIGLVPKHTRTGREIYNLFVPEKDLPPLKEVTLFQFIHNNLLYFLSVFYKKITILYIFFARNSQKYDDNTRFQS